MKHLFYSVAHEHTPRPKIRRRIQTLDETYAYLYKDSQRIHSCNVYLTRSHEILPATFVGNLLPHELWLQYPDYKEVNASITGDDDCLVKDGTITRRGQEVAKQLKMPADAQVFIRLARENMHFKHQLGVIYITTSDKDPERRSLQPSL
ncbi:MAG: hypothetical protein DYH13_10095 [Alphaproteobacteria bacterium PRO2]|nr:hypothetical protein [Alphaproteobacteria bacterium PRO2]